MKKILLISIFFIFLRNILPAQELGLGDAIFQSARGVEDALPQGSMVAVLNFASSSEVFSDYVIEELTGELVNGHKVTIVDRQNLALVREEMHLQLSGEVSDESAQAIGKILGAQSIVSGTLTDMGNFYRFRIRAIQVETAEIQTQVSLDLHNDDQVAYLLRGTSADGRPIEASNIKNWFSAELGLFYFGAGARYERMLGPKTSIGINAYWVFNPDWAGNYNSYSTEDNYGVDAFFRFYPWGKFFFIGAAAGFYYRAYYEDSNHNLSSASTMYGIGVTAETGIKIDVGNPGGFYIQPGATFTVIFGKNNYKEDSLMIEDTAFGFKYFGSRLVYFGMGYAF